MPNQSAPFLEVLFWEILSEFNGSGSYTRKQIVIKKILILRRSDLSEIPIYKWLELGEEMIHKKYSWTGMLLPTAQTVSINFTDIMNDWSTVSRARHTQDTTKRILLIRIPTFFSPLSQTTLTIS